MISQSLCWQPKVEHVDDVTTITFTPGKVDGEPNFIARELFGLTEGLGQRRLSLDLRNVNSLVSAEVATLVLLSVERKAAGGRLTLVNVNPHIGEVFQGTKLNKFLDIRKEGPPTPRPGNTMKVCV